jgi:hypothetical protein
VEDGETVKKRKLGRREDLARKEEGEHRILTQKRKKAEKWIQGGGTNVT